MKKIIAIIMVTTVLLCGCSQNQVYEEEFFEEAKGMRTPSSFSDKITFDYTENSDGISKYIFKLPKNLDEANSIYNEYIEEIHFTEGFTTDVIDDIVYIYKENKLISLMKAGTNEDGSLFLMVTFK